MSHLRSFYEFLQFMKQAAATYRRAGQSQTVGYYATVSRYGVPVATCLIAHGREAWRVSNLALEAYQWKEIE